MDILHKVPPALWLQFPASDSEASVRMRFKQLHGCEPERVCEVHLGNNKFILAGPVKVERDPLCPSNR